MLRTGRQHCDFHAAALDCISYHLRVHPLKIRGKTPILKGWQDKATTEAAPLRQWAQDYPHANAGIVAGAAIHDPGNVQRYEIQQKFAIPVACIVLALIGLALGVSNRKDSQFSSFVLGFGVIFAYYVVLWTVRAAAFKSGGGTIWRIHSGVSNCLPGRRW